MVTSARGLWSQVMTAVNGNAPPLAVNFALPSSAPPASSTY
jgi:hypothetical protein